MGFPRLESQKFKSHHQSISLQPLEINNESDDIPVDSLRRRSLIRSEKPFQSSLKSPLSSPSNKKLHDTPHRLSINVDDNVIKRKQSLVGTQDDQHNSIVNDNLSRRKQSVLGSQDGLQTPPKLNEFFDEQENSSNRKKSVIINPDILRRTSDNSLYRSRKEVSTGNVVRVGEGDRKESSFGHNDEVEEEDEKGSTRDSHTSPQRLRLERKGTPSKGKRRPPRPQEMKRRVDRESNLVVGRSVGFGLHPKAWIPSHVSADASKEPFPSYFMKGSSASDVSSDSDCEGSQGNDPVEIGQDEVISGEKKVRRVRRMDRKRQTLNDMLKEAERDRVARHKVAGGLRKKGISITDEKRDDKESLSSGDDGNESSSQGVGKFKIDSKTWRAPKSINQIYANVCTWTKKDVETWFIVYGASEEVIM